MEENEVNAVSKNSMTRDKAVQTESNLLGPLRFILRVKSSGCGPTGGVNNARFHDPVVHGKCWKGLELCERKKKKTNMILS